MNTDANINLIQREWYIYTSSNGSTICHRYSNHDREPTKEKDFYYLQNGDPNEPTITNPINWLTDHTEYVERGFRIERVLIDASVVSSIPNGAFVGWERLQYVEILSNEVQSQSSHVLTDLGTGAFKNCKLLHKVELPDQISQLKDGLFEECANLCHIHVPTSLISIGDRAFQSCGMKIIDLTKCIHLKYIGVCAFRSCTSMTSLDLSNCLSLEHIDNTCFGACESLEMITLPSSLKRVGRSAFDHCWELEIIHLPPSLESIGDYAFEFCTSLRLVYIPGRAMKNAQRVFWKCKNVLILTDDESYQHKKKASFSLRGIQHCIKELPSNITSQRNGVVALQNILNQHYPLVGEYTKSTQMSLLHLIPHFPDDTREIMSELIEKCPNMVYAIDKKGRTPLHHATLYYQHSMNTQSFQFLLKHSGPKIVFRALRCNLGWEKIKPVLEKKLDGLIWQDPRTGLFPFMMIAVPLAEQKVNNFLGSNSSHDDFLPFKLMTPSQRKVSLTTVYEIFRMRPDILTMIN